MRKYKFFKFTRFMSKNWIYIIPTVEIRLNDMVYSENNLSIILHFICFHFRWMFTKE